MSVLERINPIELGKRLEIARNTAGITQEVAAKVIGISRPTFANIENGKRRVKAPEFVKLAELYDTSCNSLLRQNAIHVDISLQFRQSAPNYENNQDALKTERILQKLAGSYVELEHQLSKPLRPVYPAERPIIKSKIVYEQAEDLALEIRQSLGLGLAPIPNMMTLLESAFKIRLFIHQLPSKIAGAFVYQDDLGACIIINAKHHHTRQAMTAAHELGHFYTTRQIPQISSENENDKNLLAERFANRFAAAFLMPAPAIRKYYQEIVQENSKFSPRDLFVLTDTFHVSLEAMVRRLENLFLFPKGSYEALQRQGISSQKMQEVVGNEQEANHILKYPRYLLLAVEAYEKDLITEGQFSEMFDLSRIEVRELIDSLTEQDIDMNADIDSLMEQNLDTHADIEKQIHA